MAKVVVPANSVLFGDLCQVFEQIAKGKSKKEKEKCLEKFIYDFKLKAASIDAEKDTSFYPILRLLVPKYDGRKYNMQESKLGALLIKVLSIRKDSHDGRKLLNHRSHEGDFASVAYYVFKSRMSTKSSKMTIGDINVVLDKIVHMEAGNKGQMLDDLFSDTMLSLTAEHYKWFLRLVLKNLKLGLSYKEILSCYHPDAPELYATCSSDLTKVCEELEDGLALSMEVKMFYAFDPMLSKRLDVTEISKLPPGKIYQIEEKFDGERFQMHMENGVFEYFSRRGKSYTMHFGKTFESGLLTPLLKGCFSASVTSFILDGEMMGWHKQNEYLGTKGMAYDIKKITEKSQFRPCFCAFDVLFLNGQNLSGPPENGGLPLRDRLKRLNMMFTEVKGALLRSKIRNVQQNTDILEALNKAIDSQEEGIVVKDTGSYYILGARNAGWYKIKPEYTEGATEDLDLVIIGADEAENKRQGRARSFLLACADSVGEGASPHRWLCVGRVSTGLTHAERERVCSHLAKHWHSARERPPPPALVLNNIKPDFWIMPEHSIVLQLRATELIQSSNFATSYTLRFPRVVKIRDDKPVKDILTLDELNKLVQDNGAVVKMSNKRINEDQIGDAAPKTCKKPTTSPRQIVADHFQVKQSDVQATSAALLDRKICVISGDDDCSKHELDDIIRTHGGVPVANDGPDTWCCIVGIMTYKASRRIKYKEADVISTAWLRSLPPSTKPCAITPLDLLAMKRETRINFAREYDEFGDSYTEEIDEDTLRMCFQKMDDEPQIYLTNKEMLDLDNELFNGCNPHSFLRACFIHTRKNLLAIQARMYGAKLCDSDSKNITHFVVNKKDKGNIERGNALVVAEEWLKKCILEKKLVDGSEFLI